MGCEGVQKKAIEDNLLNILENNFSEDIFNLIKKQVFPSKRIRSYFLYLLSKDSINNEMFDKLAVSFELFHQATLIFDDVIDDDDVRDGGRITLHKILKGGVSGSGKADHIATGLTLLAEKELIKLNDFYILNDFNEMRIMMFKSQLIDVGLSKKDDNTTHINCLLNDSYGKTSRFMETIFSITSIKLNESEVKINDLKRLGKNIGILYQIGDDICDIDNGSTSKTLSLTYQLAYLLDHEYLLAKKELEIIKSVFGKKVMNQKNASSINSLFKTHREKISESAFIVFKESFDFITKSESINIETKNNILEVLKKVTNQNYWNYKI